MLPNVLDSLLGFVLQLLAIGGSNQTFSKGFINDHPRIPRIGRKGFYFCELAPHKNMASGDELVSKIG